MGKKIPTFLISVTFFSSINYLMCRKVYALVGIFTGLIQLTQFFQDFSTWIAFTRFLFYQDFLMILKNKIML